ncbi:endosulfine alpha isoform X2 [Brevipalpus obovatus]|uniref:endosulfine alpha isoform X2 n=1 Tax=Brevipalpus obovatus TaxID=246614 RepID=UPI003D9E21EA
MMSSSEAAKHQQQQQTVEDNSVRIEKEEEAKLKAKYPSVQRPGPLFLQRRLQKGAKYFDSGDYNMAKAAMKKKTESDKTSS